MRVMENVAHFVPHEDREIGVSGHARQPGKPPTTARSGAVEDSG